MPAAKRARGEGKPARAAGDDCVVEEAGDVGADETFDERFAAGFAAAGEDEDGSEDSGGESDGEDDEMEGGGLAGFAGEKSKGQDKLWSDPTHAEMKGLKESELHFKSSLLRMQMDELKAQVSVDYTKTASLEAWLHSFKSVLEGLPAAELSTDLLSEESVVEKMSFAAPTAVHMVGSYLLRTVTRPDLVVDLVVEMPTELLHHKDFLNCKYLDKRQLYLAHLGEVLRGQDTISSISFSAFRGDPTKPCVLIKPAGLSGLSGKFSVRLLAMPPPDFFPLARFRPSRNNVRKAGITDIALQPPTPSYNSAVAEDLRMVHHLELLHAEFANCAALAETATLLKVWMRQRSLLAAPDSFNGFTVSMLLLYLVQHRRISRAMSCYHMLRAVFVYLAKKDALEAGSYLTPAPDASAAPAEALAEFVGNGQPVLLDDSLAVNLLARVSPSALAEVQHEARAALLCLEQDSNNGFAPLMLQRVSVACKFDEILVVRAAQGAAERPGGGQWRDSDEMLGEGEPGLAPAVGKARRALGVVQEALGDRLHFARVLSRESVENPLAAAAAGGGGGGGRSAQGGGGDAAVEHVLARKAWSEGGKGGGELVIGLVLNAECAGRKVERGPAAENAEAARRFRKFWGDKAELRRFKDGAIQETLVWAEADSPAGPMAVPAAMAGFALQRHLGGPVSVKGAGSWAGKALCKAAGGAYGVDPAVKRSANGELTAVADGEVEAARAFDQLGKALLALGYDDGLTLPIMSIQPVTTVVRGLGVSLLSPHPLCRRDPTSGPEGSGAATDGSGKRKREEGGGGKGAQRLPLCVPAVDCVVSLQDSGEMIVGIGCGV